MSKKKKFKNVWDLTAEEQMAAIDDVFGLGKVKDAPLDENCLNASLAQKIVCDVVGKVYAEPTSDIQPVITNDVKSIPYSEIDTIENDSEKKQSLSSFLHKLDDTDTLKFDFIEELDRVIVDDHVSPTTLSIKYIELTDIDFENGDYDADNIGKLFNELYFYIITCKHPFAIADIATLENDIKQIKSFNNNRFLIVSIDYYYLIYIIDEDSKNKFLSIPEIYKMDDKRTLQLMVTLCYNAGATQNIFFNEDMDYIKKYKEYTDKLNRYETFLDILNDDDDTIFKSSISDEADIPVLDATYLQRNVRETLMKLTDEEDDYDDEDEEDVDDAPTCTCQHNSVNETNEEEDEYANLLDDIADEKIDVEQPTTNTTSTNSSNDNAFSGTFPVIKKH